MLNAVESSDNAFNGYADERNRCDSEVHMEKQGDSHLLITK